MKTFTASLVAACLLMSSAHAEQTTSSKKIAIVPEGMEFIPEQYGYSPAVRAGDFVYLAGVVATLPKNDQGEIVEANTKNLQAAYTTAFSTIATVLQASGADWDDVVEMTTYHTDLHGQINALFPIKQEWVKEPYPAWTAIDIDGLFPEGGVTEIKVIAYAPLEN